MQYKITVRECITIAARPSSIWSVLTRPEYSREYLDYSVYSLWTKGSDIHWEIQREGQKHIIKKGMILDIVPGLFLHFTMQDIDRSDSETVSTSYELLPDENGLKLIVVQEWPAVNGDDYEFHARNLQVMLRKIKRIAEFSSSEKIIP